MAREYASLMGPALGTPEATAGLASAMRHVVATIVTIDIPIVVIVAIASYVLARAAIAPIDAARQRERIFASDAAHELRTPLTAISTVAQAARANASPESRAAFEDIARTAHEASEIVSGLLTLAPRSETRRAAVRTDRLGIVVAMSARDLASMAAGRGIALEAETGSAIVDGDERRLRELVRNRRERTALRAYDCSHRLRTHGTRVRTRRRRRRRGNPQRRARARLRALLSTRKRRRRYRPRTCNRALDRGRTSRQRLGFREFQRRRAFRCHAAAASRCVASQ